MATYSSILALTVFFLDRGGWRATFYGVKESRTRLSNYTFSFLWIKPPESEDLSMGTHCPPPSPRARGRGVQKKAKQATGSNVHHRPIILLTSPFPIRRSRDGDAPQNSWESEERISNWRLAVENRGWDLVVRKRKYQTKKGR